MYLWYGLDWRLTNSLCFRSWRPLRWFWILSNSYKIHNWESFVHTDTWHYNKPHSTHTCIYSHTVPTNTHMPTHMVPKTKSRNIHKHNLLLWSKQAPPLAKATSQTTPSRQHQKIGQNYINVFAAEPGRLHHNKPSNCYAEEGCHFHSKRDDY